MRLSRWLLVYAATLLFVYVILTVSMFAMGFQLDIR